MTDSIGYISDCFACHASDRPWAITDHAWNCYWADPFNADGYDAMECENAQVSDAIALPAVIPASTTAQYSGQSWTFGQYCEHALDPYSLSDGTVIYLSGSSDAHARTWEPDLAVYLSQSWTPRTIAYNVGWVDYGLPLLTMGQVLQIARTAYDAAKSGLSVEIGCMGGHGRTGTFVAILELLAQDSPDHALAVSKVRSEHCSKAVETAEQAYYVRQVQGLLTGTYVPAYVRPRSKVTKPAIVISGLAGKRKKSHRRGKK